MVQLPVRGMLVQVALPPAHATLLAQFLVSGGLSRERVDGNPIRNPQAWSDATCRSVLPGAVGAAAQVKLKREKLPLYWQYSSRDRPDWLSEGDVFGILLNYATPAGHDFGEAHPERTAVVLLALEALVGHPFMHEDACQACRLAWSGRGREALRWLEVDGRAVWDLHKAFTDMFWLPELVQGRSRPVRRPRSLLALPPHGHRPPS